MLLDLVELVNKYGLRIDGVIHVGAHLAEEAKTYDDLGIKKVRWIEANPYVISKIQRNLEEFPDQKLMLGLIADDDSIREFHITNYDGMSSSILEFGTHPQFSPDTVFEQTIQLKSYTLDFLSEMWDFSNCNMLNMDIQGAELMALKGATNLLSQIDYIYSEINNEEVYVGCAKVWELQEFLAPLGFKLVEEGWVEGQGWGDGLLCKEGKYKVSS